MKIKNLSNNNMKDLSQLKSKKTNKADNPTELKSQSLPEKMDAKAVKDSTKVDVSQAAQQMNKAKTLATPSDDVDHAKVARLQKMIDEGSYKVDSMSIADKLVDSHFLLGE